jgi:hypothetical protein
VENYGRMECDLQCREKQGVVRMRSTSKIRVVIRVVEVLVLINFHESGT